MFKALGALAAVGTATCAHGAAVGMAGDPDHPAKSRIVVKNPLRAPHLLRAQIFFDGLLTWGAIR
jgi:hypothetical protein